MYCLACNQEVIEKFHTYVAYYDDEFGNELDWCDGDEGELICSCPPPVVGDLDDIEPTDEELEWIEQDAENLLLEL